MLQEPLPKAMTPLLLLLPSFMLLLPLYHRFPLQLRLLLSIQTCQIDTRMKTYRKPLSWSWNYLSEAKNIVCFMQILYSKSNSLKLSSPTFTMTIYTQIPISSATSVKITLKLLRPTGTIKSLLLPCFSTDQWSNKSTSINNAPRPRTQ